MKRGGQSWPIAAPEFRPPEWPDSTRKFALHNRRTIIVATEIAVTPERLMQLGLGFMGSKTLLSAIELGVFTELGNGPLDLQQLTEKLGLHTRGAQDFFDTLVALGLLEREDGKYRN